MKRLTLVLALLALAPACRRRRNTVRAHDPRREFATACPDPRYVNAPAVAVPSVGESAVRSVLTVRLAERRHVAWVTDEGAVLWREGSPVATRVTPPIPGGSFAMDATRDRLVMAWPSSERQVLVATLDTSGATRAFSPWAGGVTEVALAATTDAALVVWREPRGVMARPLGPHGEPTRLSTLVAPAPADAPTVVWAGGAWVILWRAVEGETGFVRMRTIGRDGALRGDSVDVVRTDASLGPPAARWGSARIALTWSDARNGDRGLQASTVHLAGRSSGEPQRLSARFAEGARASIAWDGAAFGVTWWEPVGGGAPRAFFALLDRNGRRMGTGMRLRADDDTAALTTPAVDWERPRYVLAVARGAEVELRYTGPLGCDFPPYVAQAPR